MHACLLGLHGAGCKHCASRSNKVPHSSQGSEARLEAPPALLAGSSSSAPKALPGGSGGSNGLLELKQRRRRQRQRCHGRRRGLWQLEDCGMHEPIAPLQQRQVACAGWGARALCGASGTRVQVKRTEEHPMSCTPPHPTGRCCACRLSRCGRLPTNCIEVFSADFDARAQQGGTPPTATDMHCGTRNHTGATCGKLCECARALDRRQTLGE